MPISTDPFQNKPSWCHEAQQRNTDDAGNPFSSASNDTTEDLTGLPEGSAVKKSADDAHIKRFQNFVGQWGAFFRAQNSTPFRLYLVSYLSGSHMFFNNAVKNNHIGWVDVLTLGLMRLWQNMNQRILNNPKSGWFKKIIFFLSSVVEHAIRIALSAAIAVLALPLDKLIRSIVNRKSMRDQRQEDRHNIYSLLNDLQIYRSVNGGPATKVSFDESKDSLLEISHDYLLISDTPNQKENDAFSTPPCPTLKLISNHPGVNIEIQSKAERLNDPLIFSLNIGSPKEIIPKATLQQLKSERKTNKWNQQDTTDFADQGDALKPFGPL